MQRPPKRLKMGDLFYSETYIFAKGLIYREEEIVNGTKGMKASCSHCSKTWHLTDKKAYSTTSNYRRHYKKYHSDIQIDYDDEEEQDAANSKREQQSQLKQSNITIFAQLTKPEQNTLSSYIRGKNEPFNDKIFIKLVINFIISCNLPIQTCNAPSFYTLLSYCYPTAPKISPQKLLKVMVQTFEDSGNALQKKLQEHLSDGSRVALTCDIWTSTMGTSYLAITVHWIDKDWVTHGRLLAFSIVPPSHSAPNIYMVLKRVTRRFGIQNHIISITTDSADPNRIACELFEKWPLKHAEEQEIQTNNIKPAPEPFTAAKAWHSCLAHGANRSAQDILSSLKVKAPTAKEREELLYSQVTEKTFVGSTHETAMKKVRRIIVKNKRSEQFRVALYNQCIAYEIKPKSLVLDMEVILPSFLLIF